VEIPFLWEQIKKAKILIKVKFWNDKLKKNTIFILHMFIIFKQKL
jgi:hypothetical protein